MFSSDQCASYWITVCKVRCCVYCTSFWYQASLIRYVYIDMEDSENTNVGIWLQQKLQIIPTFAAKLWQLTFFSYKNWLLYVTKWRISFLMWFSKQEVKNEVCFIKYKSNVFLLILHYYITGLGLCPFPPSVALLNCSIFERSLGVAVILLQLLLGSKNDRSTVKQ